jgi:hypothetical protein
VKIDETLTFLRWLCEHEYRIQYSDAAVEIWHYALRAADSAVSKQAVLEHYRANEAVVASPGGIAKRAGYIQSAREAGSRAIEAPSHNPREHEASDAATKRSWRARNPELWDELFERGRRDRETDLRTRGRL